MSTEPARITRDELDAETGTALPAKEVISLLDLNVDLDAALDIAAPIDLAVAANANVAAPIDAAVAANVLSLDSNATALADQGVMIDQHISGEAIATSEQDSLLDQSDDTVDAGTTEGTTTETADGSTNTLLDETDAVTGGALDGDLLNVDVNAAIDADVAAPINGAVAANANVAAPIDAAVAANVASVSSDAVAVADQDAIINQDLEDVTAEATAEQDSEITQ